MCGSRQGTGRQHPKLEKAGVGTQTKGWGRGTVRSLDDACFSGPQSRSEVVVQKKEKMVEHQPLPDLLKPGVLSSPPAAVPTVPSCPAHATCGLLSLLPKTSITPSQPGDSLLPAPETLHLKGSSHSPLPPPHTIPILFLLLNLMCLPVPAWPTQHSEGAFPQCSRSFFKNSSKYSF